MFEAVINVEADYYKLKWNCVARWTQIDTLDTCCKTAEEEPLCDVTCKLLPLDVFPSLFKCSSEANTKLAEIKSNFSCFLEGFYINIHLGT